MRRRELRRRRELHAAEVAREARYAGLGGLALSFPLLRCLARERLPLLVGPVAFGAPELRALLLRAQRARVEEAGRAYHEQHSHEQLQG
jgi:hypothetical protein